MASGSADTYARNLNRGDEQWTGGSPQSAYMELHQTGIAQLAGKMYALIHGIPRELTPELMEEMQMGQWGPDDQHGGMGSYRPETQGYTAGAGGGQGAVGDRPHGALSGADAVTSAPPDQLGEVSNAKLFAPSPSEAGWQNIQYQAAMIDDQRQTRMDRDAEFARNNPGARLSRRGADERAQFDPSGGAQPYFETPRLIPGGSSYEDSWYKGG
jgi:hypothetical protein